MGEQVDSSFFEVFQWIGGIAEEGLGAFVFQFFRPLYAVARLAAVVCSYWLWQCSWESIVKWRHVDAEHVPLASRDQYA